MSAEMVKVKLNGEYEIIIPKHRADRPEWYTAQGWERPRLAAIKMAIEDQIERGIKPVVYYVGAEEGEMPALCQIWGAKVVMFEPNPLVWPNIRAIWEANKLELPAGIFVGFASNKTDLEPPQKNIDIDGVIKDGWPSCAYGEIIGNHGFKELYQEADAFPQVAIDQMVFIQGQLAPTIISFDCEGSEWQVMKGASETLRTYKPIIFASISPEFMFHQFNQYSRDFRNWLIDFGYDESLLDYEHELHTAYTPKEQTK